MQIIKEEYIYTPGAFILVSPDLKSTLQFETSSLTLCGPNATTGQIGCNDLQSNTNNNNKKLIIDKTDLSMNIYDTNDNKIWSNAKNTTTTTTIANVNKFANIQNGMLTLSNDGIIEIVDSLNNIIYSVSLSSLPTYVPTIIPNPPSPIGQPTGQPTSQSETIYKPLFVYQPSTNVMQIDFTGTSNIYSPYLYYDKATTEKFDSVKNL